MLSDLLPGKLPRNRSVTGRLQNFVNDGTFTYDGFMRFAFSRKSVLYESWQAQDRLCPSCVTGIFRTHLHLWLIEMERQRL